MTALAWIWIASAAVVLLLLCAVAFGDARKAEALADDLRSQLEEARAMAVEERHESDYWRGLANWYADHPGAHPTAADCDRIARFADKWLPVGTLANPVLTQYDGPAIYDSLDELLAGPSPERTE